MTGFESFPNPEQGTSIEQLQLYTEVLLAAAELAESLETCPPVAEDRSYMVVDPRALSLIELPEELRGILHSSDTLESVEYHITAHRPDDQAAPLISSELTLKIGDDIIAGIQALPDSTEHFLMTLLNGDGTSSSKTIVSADEVSRIIARITHPNSDPMFSDYREPNAGPVMQDISETLDNSMDIATSHELIYELDNTYRILIHKNNDRLRAIEITDIRFDQPSTTLVIELGASSSGSALYRTEANGSRELEIDQGDLIRFRETIETLKSMLQVAEYAASPDLDEMPASDHHLDIE